MLHRGAKEQPPCLLRKNTEKKAAEDERPGEDPMPCASWPHRVLYTAAIELLMDAPVVKVGFDL